MSLYGRISQGALFFRLKSADSPRKHRILQEKYLHIYLNVAYFPQDPYKLFARIKPAKISSAFVYTNPGLNRYWVNNLDSAQLFYTFINPLSPLHPFGMLKLHVHKNEKVVSLDK